MDNCSERLKQICCTCLSSSRKLRQLCKVKDGVNNLFYLLSYNTESYEAMFHKPTTNFFICWECEAMMHRLCRFREQVSMAQKQLSGIIDGKIDTKIPSLSKLSHTLNTDYNCQFIFNEATLDNFIDCDDDFKTEFDLTPPIKREKKPLLEIKPLKVGKRSVEKKRKRKDNCDVGGCYSVVILSEEEMHERRERRKEEESFVRAEFKCESCIVVFKDENELEVHNVDLHVQKPRNMQCDICKVYISYWRLTSHITAHRQMYKCTICDDVHSATHMLKHLRTHGVPLGGLTELKKTAMLLNTSLKIRRRRKCEKTPFGYMCSDCNKCFDDKYLRYKHIMKCHRDGFRCTTCGKSFVFRNTLNKHQQTHAPPLPREQCKVCNKPVRLDRVKAHARIHSDRQTFHCATCDKHFISHDSYEKHLKNSRSHAVHDVHKYKCTLCVKGFRTLTELNDHTNYKHMGRTQYKCPVCDKALATRRGVTRHVRRTHEGLKEKIGDKILCQTCGKAFRDKKCLQEHELIHTGEKPLSCDLCGRTFRQNACLYTHKRRVHKMAPKRQVIHTDDIKTD